MLKTGGQRHWIDGEQVPYVVKGDQWVGYDDKQSLKEKVKQLRFVLQQKETSIEISFH